MLLRPLPTAGAKRRNPRAGDAFVYHPGNANFFWGRLLKTPFSIFGTKGHLILLYDVGTTDSDQVPWDAMASAELLVPPIVINGTPWSKGYFRSVEGRPLGPEDARHPIFFVNQSRECVDSDGDPIAASPLSPDAMLPTFGLSNVRLVDELLKQRLGVPTLKSLVDHCVTSFCAARDLPKPGPAWISGIMLALDEEASDGRLLDYLGRAFSRSPTSVPLDLNRELRKTAEAYSPETMRHLRSPRG